MKKKKYFYKVYIIEIVLLLLLLMGCAPLYAPYQPPTEWSEIIEEGKLFDLSLVKYSPSNLTIQGSSLDLSRIVIRKTTTYSRGYPISTNIVKYQIPSFIKAEDNTLEFEISLTQPSVSLGSLTEGYPVVFGVKITNKLDEPVKVKWENVAYIDSSGLSHRVVKTGTRFMERDRSIGDIIIPPVARIEEIILPTDAIYFGDEWRSEEVLEKLSNKDKVTIFIPIEVKGQVINYSFIFEAHTPNETTKPEQTQ